jgi:hypothetical protein
MSATKELFLKMSEQEYMSIPEDIREVHLRYKIYSESLNDFNELMQDFAYSELYNKRKKISKQLDERQHELREKKRNNKN